MRSIRSIPLLTLAMLLLAFCGAARAEEHTVGQKNKAFSPPTLKIKAGDSVGFRNDDAFFHNVFSLSPVQTFDLGSFPKGQTRKVTFNREGKVEIECAIHPEMKMVIEVVK